MSGGNNVASGHQKFLLLLKQFGAIALKYQTWVSICRLTSNRTSVVFKEHLAAFSLTFFTYASKLNLHTNIEKKINFKN